VLSKLQKVSKLRLSYVTSLIVTPHYLHGLVMDVVDFFVLTFDECFELLMYSNERRLINCVLTLLREDCQARKLNKEDAVDRCKWRKMIKEAR